jgi:hypothetical protein
MHQALLRSIAFLATGALTGALASAGNTDEFWAANAYLPSTLHRVQWTNGATSSIAMILNIEPTDIAMDSSGTLYACESDRLYLVDTTTGFSQLVGPINTFSPIVGLDFAPNGQLYAICYNGNVLRVDPLTGGAIQLFVLPINFSGDCAMESNTIMYATFNGPSEDHLARIDVGINGYTDLGPIATGQGVWGMDFDGAGNLIAMTIGGDAFHIQNYTSSGTGTFVSNCGQGALSLTSAEGGCPSIGGYCTAGLSTNFCTPLMTASGTPSASASSGFTLSMINTEGQKQAILFYGINNSGFTPLPWGTSSSFICVKSPTQRTAAQNTGGNVGACDGSISIDWNAFIATNPGALGAPATPGMNVFAQGWYRDPPSPKTTNLSNGVRFTVCP